MSQLFRDIAAGKARLAVAGGSRYLRRSAPGGGKINERTTEDLVELITLGGEEYLLYKSLAIDVALLLRGTTAEPERQRHHGARGADR